MNLLKNFYILADALKFIEDNLCENITQERIANACYASLSSLQKLFRYAFHMSLKEYISKRRLSQAAKDLINTDETILKIALKYQYNSPEVFTRAFAKLWGIAPSAFRTKWRFAGIFPRIIFEYQGGNIMSRKTFDMTELYDILRSKINTYVLCFDIIGLMPINKISHDAGDKAILECVRRIDENITEDMILFRIGGDEFALVTGLTDKKEVEQLANKIIGLNGAAISHNGMDIPVSMRVGATIFKDKNIHYKDLFNNLHDAISVTRSKDTDLFIG